MLPISDLYVAQPITFESMKVASRFASSGAEVRLLTAQYPQDRSMIPEGFVATEDLDRSVLERGRFAVARKLPLLRDILDRAYRMLPPADFIIYSNVDIAVQPYFYRAVDALIDTGLDAFVINRRTISDRFTSPKELPRMYGQLGQRHQGYDCFVFRREVYPHLALADLCIGTGRVGLGLICNLIAWSEKFKLFSDLHLTFHLGNNKQWTDQKYEDYQRFNTEQIVSILHNLVRGPQPPPNRKALVEFLTQLASHRNVPFVHPFIDGPVNEPQRKGWVARLLGSRFEAKASRTG